MSKKHRWSLHNVWNCEFFYKYGRVDTAQRLGFLEEISVVEVSDTSIVARDVFALTHPELDYIISTFPPQQRDQEAEFSEFRSRLLILESYDAVRE